MSASLSRVLEDLKQAGFPARIVSVHHLGELRDDLEGHRTSGRLDPVLYRRYLNRFAFDLLKEQPTAKSIIIATAPQPSLLVTFTHAGRTVESLVPPTYTDHTDQQIEDAVQAVLRPAGQKAARVRLPEKLLVTRSGLGCYGKNNITYVEGFGSYHRPMLLWTDAGSGRDDWQEARMLDRCGHCIACLEKCPTGSILPDRFLIQADRCLTFHNEGEEPFPEWIEPSWHNALVGCLVCQEICPENKAFARRHRKTVVFSETETRAILGHKTGEALPEEIAGKLESVWPEPLMHLLPRNLGVLLDK